MAANITRRDNQYMCLQMEEFNMTYEAFLPKKNQNYLWSSIQIKKKITGNTGDKEAF